MSKRVRQLRKLANLNIAKDVYFSTLLFYSILFFFSCILPRSTVECYFWPKENEPSLYVVAFSVIIT